MTACFRVESLVANFPNRLETKLEMSLSHRRDLNNLIKNDSSTIDQVESGYKELLTSGCFQMKEVKQFYFPPLLLALSVGNALHEPDTL